jgi:son of sevenless
LDKTQAARHPDPVSTNDNNNNNSTYFTFSVLNTFKSMIVDEDILEKDDMYILDRMKEFISQEEVSKLAAAKQLMILIERSVRHRRLDFDCLSDSPRQQKGGDPKVLITTSQERPPPPILPRNSKKLKLLDIDPLELARQLTLMESSLYQKIRPMECLVRSRKQSGEHNDNIATIIQLCNRVRSPGFTLLLLLL